MKKVFVCFLVVFVTSAHAQSDATTDCSKMDFTALAKDCCLNPFPKIFPSAILLTTLKDCNATCPGVKWANNYQINKIQKQSMENYIDLTAATTITELCSAGTYMQCLFTKNNWLLASGGVDITAIYQHLDAVYSPDATWKKLLDNVLRPIYPSLTNAYDFADMVVDKFETITCPSGQVNLKPLMFIQMLQSEFIWMCPKQNTYTAANMCTERMRNYLFCDGKIYSPLAKGVFFFPAV